MLMFSTSIWHTANGVQRWNQLPRVHAISEDSRPNIHRFAAVVRKGGRSYNLDAGEGSGCRRLESTTLWWYCGLGRSWWRRSIARSSMMDREEWEPLLDSFVFFTSMHMVLVYFVRRRVAAKGYRNAWDCRRSHVGAFRSFILFVLLLEFAESVRGAVRAN